MLKAILQKLVKNIIEFRLNREFAGKISKINKHLKREIVSLNPDLIKKHKKLWSRLKPSVNTKWLKVFATISGKYDAAFVPEDIYYNVIEPRLNNRIFTFAYADKNFYDLLYREKNLFPDIILRKINGVIYDAEYAPVELKNENLTRQLQPNNKLIIKPSAETGGGRSVKIIEFSKERSGYFFKDSGEIVDLKSLTKLFKHNFVIQKLIDQHAFFAKFNSSSVNTVRVFAYRSIISEKVIPLQAVLRIGKPGSTVDNQASGGISCGIDNEGKLNAFAIDKLGNKYFEFNRIKFNNRFQVPYLDEIYDITKRVGRFMFYSRLNGFDFCVDREGKVRLLEINTKNIETNFMQMSNGPLFGNYTDEVIEYCLDQEKVVSINMKFK